MERKIVHVVGTGTIGEPLIGLLCTDSTKALVKAGDLTF